MKKSKLIATLCTLVLTLACLTFGVYSAVKTSFTASGTITFNAYDIRCDVECSIIGIAGGDRTIYGTTFQDGTERTNYTSTTGLLSGVVDLSASNAKFELGDFAFDELNENNLIIIKFTVTNYSNYAIEATATIGEISTLDITNSPITYCYAAENNGTVIDSRELVLTFAPKAGSAAFIENLNMSINITPSSKTITTEGFTTSVSGDKVTITEYTGSDTEVIIPRMIDGNIVTTIGRAAISSERFENCDEITSIVIPSSVTIIENCAFQSCSNLSSIAIPSSVTSIGESAFDSCSSLTSITIPESVTSIGDSAFYSCSSLTTIVVESGNTKYDSRNNCNAIIETATNTLIRGCKNTTIPSSVTSIENYAFADCSSLTAITIPSSVTSIENGAFYGCSSLTTITIPEGVTSIGNRAFDYCSSLTEITIPASVTSIGNSAFYNCSSLTEITIPEGVTSIGNSAFERCSSLTTIEIPDSVTSIGSSAFSSCSSLTTITIPDSVTSIGSSAFSSCSSLTSIKIPNSVTSIDDSAFAYCSSLTTIVVESGNTKYDSRNNCNAIIETATNTLIRGCKNTTIPSSVTSIGDSAFSSCDSLTTIEIPASVTSIGDDAFSYCSSLTEITIPASVTSIGNSAFYNCSSLTEITIPSSVTSIEAAAFSGCSSLSSITIPSSVTSIGSSAFSGCSGLTSLTIEGATADNWAYGNDYNVTYATGKKIDLTNPATNATYFVETYYNKWFVKQA